MDETEIKGISNRSENAWMLPLKIVLTYARSAIDPAAFGLSVSGVTRSSFPRYK
jgi:hypothetical protein